MFTNLQMTYGDDNFPLTFKLHSHNVVGKWIERVQSAQANYQIDDPARFYGFGEFDEQIQSSLLKINNCISVINSHEKIIDKELTNINDQDTLNYLHHIFEVYHGLLNRQNHPFWLSAPMNVRSALAELNILVHRCESVSRGAHPRHVVTYYGLPKTEVLATEDYSLFEDQTKFGTVYLNYVEIGKTFEDLALDNDKYINDDAFRPFSHYSADFNVRFWNESDLQLGQKRAILKEYYKKNSFFFEDRNLPSGHPMLAVGSIPLATLVDAPENLLEILETRQKVTSVTFN